MVLWAGRISNEWHGWISEFQVIMDLQNSGHLEMASILECDLGSK